MIHKDDQDAIREPRQDRSRQTMDRVLEALEKLLAEKPFDKITMVELAQRSGTGTSSIYARFQDKRSLMLGVHGRLQEQVFPCLDRLFDAERLKDKPLADILSANIATVTRFYRQHGQIVRAALLVDGPFVYERQIAVHTYAADRLSDLVLSRVQPKDRKAFDAAVDTGVRLVTSMMYQILIFRDFRLLRRPISDRTLVQQLTSSVMTLLEDATQQSLKGR